MKFSCVSHARYTVFRYLYCRLKRLRSLSPLPAATPSARLRIWLKRAMCTSCISFKALRAVEMLQHPLKVCVALPCPCERPDGARLLPQDTMRCRHLWKEGNEGWASAPCVSGSGTKSGTCSVSSPKSRCLATSIGHGHGLHHRHASQPASQPASQRCRAREAGPGRRAPGAGAGAAGGAGERGGCGCLCRKRTGRVTMLVTLHSPTLCVGCRDRLNPWH